MTYFRDWVFAALAIMLMIYLGMPDAAGKVAAQAAKAYNAEMARP